MGKMQRRKGLVFENTCVHAAAEAGLEARRTSINQSQDGDATFGDITIESERYECKNQQGIGDYLWKWLKGNDGLIIKRNGRPPLMVIPYDEYLEMLKTLEDKQ